MSVNIKPINDVPVVEEVTAGDKVLVNRSGAAVQIDASKVGGGGGAAGGVVYADIMGALNGESSTGFVQAFVDIEMTTPMDYATGKNILLGAGKLAQDFSAMSVPGAIAYVVPTAIIDAAEEKGMQAQVQMGPEPAMLLITFSDSVMG